MEKNEKDKDMEEYLQYIHNTKGSNIEYLNKMKRLN